MDPAQYLDALLSLPRMWGPKVSRDGKWMAWTWFRVGPAADVYVAPTDGSANPLQLTETLENTFLVSWTPDCKAVIVEQDKGGNERAQLFRVDLEQPLAMVPLTEPDPNYFIRGGELHPNGRWLFYGANLDVTTGEEIEATWLYRHDLETGAREVLARPDEPHYVVPHLNAMGSHILYNRADLHPAGEQIWLVDIEGHEDREILNVGADLKAYASWFPDGQRAVVLAETKTHRRLGIWDMQNEAVRWLVDDPKRNIEHAYVPYGSEKIVVIEIQQAQARASLLDPDTGISVGFPDVSGNLIPMAPIGEGTWAAQYYSSRQPTDVVRLAFDSPRSQAFESLSRVWERTPLTQDTFAAAEAFYWKSVDGMDIQGWLYRPAGSAQGTIVYIHGGPTAHSQDKINAQIQYFVQQGFNVLDPNYRGSSGFSLDFQEAIKVDGWGGLEQIDIRAGIEALIAAGVAVPGKVGITGTSYGGYSAWWAITRFPLDVVAASAPICGMTDLVLDYQNTRPDLRPYSEEMMGGNPDEVPDRYYERSPINFVQNIRGRLLIVQGLQDPNVSPENVRAVREALDEAHIPYEILTFDDEGHGISKPKNQKVLFQRLLAFFQQAFEGA